MKFFFPDSQDMVYPAYNFIEEEYPVHRVRQRDDQYVHEVLGEIPFDGILVSKAIVDGISSRGGKYTSAQRQRLHRLGVNDFFRLPPGTETVGDCGAFNYVAEEEPPYTVKEVLSFYTECGFSSGVSVDHVILGFKRNASDMDVPASWPSRQRTTLELAEEFFGAAISSNSKIEPWGAAQGWSPESYAQSVFELQEIGYSKIALGGMVPLRTPDVIDSLIEIQKILLPSTRLHLLGITRLDAMNDFADFGVESFDSTSPFRQAFMDDQDNYHTIDGKNFVAIRIPQVDGNPTLRKLVLSGKVDGTLARRIEHRALGIVRSFGEHTAELKEVLEVLEEYEKTMGIRRSFVYEYQRTLEARPWERCACKICKTSGVEVIIFRGSERNKRRGFHNIHVFGEKMRSLSLKETSTYEQ